MNGLFIKISSSRNKIQKMRISEFRINESSPRVEQFKFPVGFWIKIPKTINEEGNKFRFLKCPHCGFHDFNEDGERLCDYVCNGCDMTISALEYKKENDMKN